MKSHHSFIFSLIKNLSNHQTKNSGFETATGSDKFLAIIDDSCEDILESASGASLATTGWVETVVVIFIKHNLYQQGKYSVTVDKITTPLVILKSLRRDRQL